MSDRSENGLTDSAAAVANSWTDLAREVSLAVRRAKAALRAWYKANGYADFPGVVADFARDQVAETQQWLTDPDRSMATTGNPSWNGEPSTLPKQTSLPVWPPRMTDAQEAAQEAKAAVLAKRKADWKAANPGKTDLDYAQTVVDGMNQSGGGLSTAAAAVKARKRKAWFKAHPGGTEAEWEVADAANLAAWKAAHPRDEPHVGPEVPDWKKRNPEWDYQDYLTATRLEARKAADPAGYAKGQWMVRNPLKTEADYAVYLEKKAKRDAKKKAGGS